MINPQLLDYMRRELGKGKSKEDISNDLIHGGGWLQSDVEEAFREIEPAAAAPVVAEVPLPPQPPVELPTEPIAAPAPEPIAPTPVITPEPVIVPPPVQPQPMQSEPQPLVPPPQPMPVPMSPQPSVVQQATIELLNEKKRPYILWGFLLFILSVIVFGVFAFLFEGKFFLPILVLMGAGIGVVIIAGLIFVTILGLFTSLMLHLATKCFRSIRTSWPKAVFAAGLITLMSAISTIITGIAHPGIAFIVLLTLLMLAGQITILVEVYHIRPWKAFLVGIVQAIFSLIIVGVIGLVASTVLTSLQSAQQKAQQPSQMMQIQGLQQ